MLLEICPQAGEVVRIPHVVIAQHEHVIACEKRLGASKPISSFFRATSNQQASTGHTFCRKDDFVAVPWPNMTRHKVIEDSDEEDDEPQPPPLLAASVLADVSPEDAVDPQISPTATDSGSCHSTGLGTASAGKSLAVSCFHCLIVQRGPESRDPRCAQAINGTDPQWQQDFGRGT